MARLAGDRAGARSARFGTGRGSGGFARAAVDEASEGLEAIGDNMYRETEASGQANRQVPGNEGVGTIRQGFIEDSSVDVVKEISDLIEAQRGYELNSKVITASDEMLAATTRLR